MRQKTAHRLFTLSLLVLITQEMNGQQNSTLPSCSTIDLPEKGGSFFLDVEGRRISLADQLQQMNASFGLSDQYQFSVIHESEDQLGFNHAAYQQYYLGLPVEDGMVLLHNKGDIITFLNGRVGKLPEGFSIQPMLEQSRAITIATEELGLRKSSNNSEATLVISQGIADNEYVLAYKIYLEGIGKNDIYNRMNIFIDARTGKIINKISLIAHASVQGMAHTLYSGIQEITMDSFEGGYRLRDSIRNITTLNFENATLISGRYQNLAEYTNSGTTWEEVLALDSVILLTIEDTALIRDRRWVPAAFIGDPTINSFAIQGPIYDYSRPTTAPFTFPGIGLNLLSPPYKANMSIYNTSNGQSSGKAFFYIDSMDIREGSHNWSDTLGNEGQYTIRKRANPALDAHWGMAHAYDYYKETFGRSGYNGRNTPITNLINASYAFTGSQSNAAALGGVDGIMVFGLGDRYQMDAVVCLDVLGHEFSHMVSNTNGHGGLVYQGESGALNESFSDILGTCIEFYAKDTGANWTIGEESFLRAPGMYRSMSNPKMRANPDTYQGQYWINPAQLNLDYGGVHINSGVQNKWFYLLCEGGSGTNDKKDPYQVAGIGVEKAQQIVYRNLITYLTPYAKYADAYNGSLKAAEDLYGRTGAEYKAVKDAWFAVGISDATGIQNANIASLPFKIYPNPASDKLNLSWTLNESSIVTVVVKDINSREVIRQEYGQRTIGISSAQLAIAQLNQGIYLVEIFAGTQKATGKITVQR